MNTYKNLEIQGNAEDILDNESSRGMDSDFPIPSNSASPCGIRVFTTYSRNLLILAGVAFLTLLFCEYYQGPHDPVGVTSTALSSEQPTYSFFFDRLAFGSCSAYDLREMSIWSDAIIPSNPDVWLWLGDMVYLDTASVDCSIRQNTVAWNEACDCEPTWLAALPHSCMAGNMNYAHEKWINFLENANYNEFLDFMCPQARQKGIHPPPGTNPAVCDKGIFGVYDDHDFGWDNSNRRTPNKGQLKEAYLDAVGEPVTSPRRGETRGAWEKVTLNKGIQGAEVDLFLLDERFERDATPCDTRREYCAHILSTSPANKTSSSSNSDSNGSGSTEGSRSDAAEEAQRVWCSDFLLSGASSAFWSDPSAGPGSCCEKDDIIYFGWCSRASSKASPYYREACDVSYSLFGHRPLTIGPDGDLQAHQALGMRDTGSHFCDVLGRQQRRWLREEVATSTAVLKIFASSSVLLGNPTVDYCSPSAELKVDGLEGNRRGTRCRCSGDDLDCYRVAQLEMMHIMSHASGCSIVLTGDFHYADIKALAPAGLAFDAYHQHDYSLQQPTGRPGGREGDGEAVSPSAQTIYQLMSSGLTYSTAANFSCALERLDPLGLRLHPECHFVTGPNFGLVDLVHKFDDSGSIVGTDKIILRVMDGHTDDHVLLEHTIDVGTCNAVNL